MPAGFSPTAQRRAIFDGSKNELGNARTKAAITLDGSLAKPDPTSFFTRLATAKLAELLNNGECAGGSGTAWNQACSF